MKKRGLKLIAVVLLCLGCVGEVAATNYYSSSAYNSIEYYDRVQGGPESTYYRFGTNTSVTSSSDVGVRACVKISSLTGWEYGPYFKGSVSSVWDYGDGLPALMMHRHGIQYEGSAISQIK